MIHSAGVLIEEFTALAAIGNASGQQVIAARIDALEMGTSAEYLAYLNQHVHNLVAAYNRLEAAGVPLDGFEDFIPQIYSVAFATNTGWANSQAFTGSQRVSKHLIDKLKFFKTLSASMIRKLSKDHERDERLRKEIDSLCSFISESGIPEADSNIFMIRLGAAKALLDADPIDYALAVEHLSATLGLLAMYASKITEDARKKAWQERVKTASLLLGGDLLVSLSTQGIVTGATALLSLVQ